MKLEQAFEVQAPIEQVWEALIDLERVAPCLPGATITGHDEDGTYHGEFKVKLGPTTAAYKGTVKIEEADAATHTATMRAKGTDKRGQGGANATIVNTLTAEGDVTRVSAVTDFTITGRLARFGRGGMIEDISNRLMRDFSTCLQSRIADARRPRAARRSPPARRPRRARRPPPTATPHQPARRRPRPPHRHPRRRPPPSRSAASRCSSGRSGTGSSGSSEAASAASLEGMAEGCDTGLCGADVPPLVGSILTGTGLTLDQAAAALERGESPSADRCAAADRRGARRGPAGLVANVNGDRAGSGTPLLERCGARRPGSSTAGRTPPAYWRACASCSPRRVAPVTSAR